MDEEKTKETLPLRESLIATAVAFLKNEKVKGSPLEEKKAFLQKKGMTMAEIEESIRICSIPLYQEPPSIPPRSTTSRLTPLLSAVFFTTGSAYLLYQLYQKFLKPLLYGDEKRKKKDLLDQLLANNREMNDNLVSMVATLNDLHRQVARTNSQQLLNDSSQEYKLATNEMKEEVRCLKALLLSRDRFSSIPSPKPPTIPAWQLESQPSTNHIATEKTTLDVKKTDESAEEISD